MGLLLAPPEGFHPNTDPVQSPALPPSSLKSPTPHPDHSPLLSPSSQKSPPTDPNQLIYLPGLG